MPVGLNFIMASKRYQALQYTPAALRGIDNLLNRTPIVFVVEVRQEFRIAKNNRQWIIELVRDTRDKFAQRGELRCLNKLSLRGAQLLVCGFELLVLLFKRYQRLGLRNLGGADA